MQIAVQDLNVGRRRKIGSDDLTLAPLVEAKRDGLVGVHANQQILQVQSNVLHVFLDAFDDAELMQHGVELHARGSGAGNR